MSKGNKTAIEANDEVVKVVEIKVLKKRIRQLERVLGNKTLEVEILKKTVHIGREKNHLAVALVRRGGFPVKRATDAMAVSRSNTYERSRSPRPRPKRYSKAEDAFLLPLFVDILGGSQTYDYRASNDCLTDILLAAAALRLALKRH